MDTLAERFLGRHDQFLVKAGPLLIADAVVAQGNDEVGNVWVGHERRPPTYGLFAAARNHRCEVLNHRLHNAFVQLEVVGELGVPVIADPDGVLADRLGLNNGGRLIVRPDGYVGAISILDDINAIADYFARIAS